MHRTWMLLLALACQDVSDTPVDPDPAETPEPTDTPAPTDTPTATPDPADPPTGACSDVEPPTGAHVPRAAPPAAAAAIATGANDFAFDALRQQFSDTGNALLSPISLYGALAQTLAGAEGTTESELASAMHVSDVDGLHAPLGAMLQDMHGGTTPRPYLLTLAQSAWVSDGLPFSAGWTDVLATDYGAAVTPLPTEGIEDVINDWVCARTLGHVPELVPPGAISPATVLILVNALALQADWTWEFDAEATYDAPFRTSSGTSIDVPTMHQEQSFRYASMDGVSIASLPLEGDDLSMWIVLPDEVDGLPDVVSALTSTQLDAWQAALSPAFLEVALPTLSMRSVVDGTALFTDLGAPAMFDRNQADFSAMLESSTQPVWIDKILHQATLDITEQGVIATAATAVIGVSDSDPVSTPFLVDHPYLILLRDEVTGLPLFVATVNDPS